MTDWHRMEWQVRANKIATAAMILLTLLWVDEIVWAFRYHFPWWDDIMMPLTWLAWMIAYFVRQNTEMYRIDR